MTESCPSSYESVESTEFSPQELTNLMKACESALEPANDLGLSFVDTEAFMHKLCMGKILKNTKTSKHMNQL